MTCCDYPPLKIGVLLVQLGTPDEATPKFLKKYLKEFLSDPRVVEVNRAFWFLLLRGVILQTRPKKSALLYQRLFENYGPLLRIYSESLVKQLQTRYPQTEVIVRYGMRYGNPNVTEIMRDLIEKQRCDRLLVVPLYPQYSAATTASTYDAIFTELLKKRWIPSLRIMPPYFDKDPYINSVADLVNDDLAKRTKPPQKILLSYHGIPERYVNNGDPYACMCMTTTDLLKAKLHFPAADVLHCYQSRFGKEPWLQPYTDETIKALAKEGVKDVMVVCPGFSMDCLETVDEIGVENQKIFIENGGEHLQLVSCLNDHPSWVRALFELIENELKGWKGTSSQDS